MSEPNPYRGDGFRSPEGPYGAANDVQGQSAPYLDGHGGPQSPPPDQRGFDAERAEYVAMTPTAQQAPPMATPPPPPAKKRPLTGLSIVLVGVLVLALIAIGVLTGKLVSSSHTANSLRGDVAQQHKLYTDMKSENGALVGELSTANSQLSTAQSDLSRANALLTETREPAYLASVRRSVPELNLVQDAQLLEVGHLICTRLGQGSSTTELIALAAGSYTPTEASSIVNTTQHILCD